MTKVGGARFVINLMSPGRSVGRGFFMSGREGKAQGETATSIQKRVKPSAKSR